MSRKDVEVVRAMNEPWNGRDLAATLRQRLATVDQEDREAVLEAMRSRFTEDPSWQLLHPEIVWDAGPMFGAARGLDEFVMFWPEWAGLWQSYVPHMLEYRDLGGWVLLPAEVYAVGRDGIAVDMRIFQLFQVRDGKVAVMRAFTSEQSALAAAGA